MFNYMGGWTKPWKFKFHALFAKELPFFRPRLANYGGIKIIYEDEKRFVSNPVNPTFGEDYHPGVNGSWPKNGGISSSPNASLARSSPMACPRPTYWAYQPSPTHGVGIKDPRGQ